MEHFIRDIASHPDADWSAEYKAFRHVETLFVQGRNLYLAGLLLVIQGLFTFCQPIAGLQCTDLYLEPVKFLHVERPYEIEDSLYARGILFSKLDFRYLM